jgi:arabinofuranan 3-O-arabinosyltransferase
VEPVQPTRREVGALAASCALIAVVLVAHEPGRIVPETKLDVVLDPFGALGRALVAWDPTAGFGRLQNQAVGYLAPFGAWSALWRSLGLPAWLGQRLWLAAVVGLALWGAHRVACAIGIRGGGPRLVAAWAYALAPATVSITFFQSAGQLPYALVPHVLAALLAPRPGASARRTAARSTLWIAAMGGVNGASAIAVLPLVGLWFATRRPGPDRRRLLAWWCGGAVAATLWWAIPLLVSVRSGIRFTDYTESSSVTTATESATEILRGTGNWLSYLETVAGSWLPGSWALASSRLAIVATVALAAAGLAGLARRDAPERLWLVTSLVVGASAMGMGYAGAGGGPAADAVQSLLDGPLAPLRNVHKFAAVVRLPLALGLGHLVAVAAAAARDRRARAAGADGARPDRSSGIPAAAGASALAALVVVAAIVPAIDRGLTAPGAFEDLPASWRSAAAWLEDEVPAGGRALVLPGSSFGEYRWGRPLDEPLGSLDGPDWAVRDLVPLGGNGSTRLLDGIDQALQGDALPDGFSSTLRRAGITHLVVRNDLDLERTGGPRPATVRRLLRSAPDGELELVASFGPARTSDDDDGRRWPRPGSGPGGEEAEAFRDLDVYAVAGADEGAPIASLPDAGALVASGGPEALLGLGPEVVDGRAVVLAVDDPGDLPDAVAVQTDTARRRDVEFGAVRDSSTATLTATDRSPATGEAPFDRYVGDGSGALDALTVARLDGLDALTDSRTPDGYLTPEGQPWAALDGRDDTSWVPQRGEVGEWLEVVLPGPTEVGSVRIEAARADGRRIDEVEVRTDAGTALGRLDAEGVAVVDLPPGSTERVRVTVTEIAGEPDLGTLGLRTIALRTPDGSPIAVARPLVAAPIEAPEVVVLVRDHRDRLDRARRDEDGAFDREIGWGGGEAAVDGRAVLSDGALVDELLASATEPVADEVRASASSRFRDHPATDARWAVDGDPSTAWVSDTEVGAPTLSLAWDGEVLVDALVIDVLEVGLDQVAEVDVSIGDRTERHPLGADGRVALDRPTATDRLELSFPGASADAARSVGIAEVDVPALFGRRAAVPDRLAEIELACGEGPEVSIDGQAVATAARTTVDDLLEGRPVRWAACDAVDLAPGAHRVEAERGALLASTIRLLPDDGLPAPTAARSVAVERWDAEQRSVAVGEGPASILATTENANDGWTARFQADASGDPLDGVALEPIVVDGWRQGWRVPEGGSGRVELTFGPGRIHRAGLALGGVALLGLVMVAIGAAAPGRRRTSPATAGLPARSVDRRARATVAVLAVGAGVALSPVALAIGLAIGLAAGAMASAVGRRASADRPTFPIGLGVVAAASALGAGAVALAGAGVGIYGTTGTFSGPAQVLATLAILATAGALVASDGPRSGGRPDGRSGSPGGQAGAPPGGQPADDVG